MKAALLTQLQARGALAAPVVVARALPPSIGGFYEYIGIAGPIQNQQTPVSMAMGSGASYAEDYTATVYIDVQHPGTDAVTTENRAFALMAEIEQQLEDDPQVSGTVDIAERNGYDAAARADATVREYFIAMRIRCLAYI